MAFVQCDIFSYELGMDTELTVLLPEKRQQKPIDRSNQKYKVLYLLHGHGDDIRPISARVSLNCWYGTRIW